MSPTGLIGPAHVQRRLAALPALGLNFERSALRDGPPPGFRHDQRCQPLPAEQAGEPQGQGSFSAARRLIAGYEFADPSIVRAHYDPRTPLLGRNMVLQLRALGLISVYVGVRVLEVFDERREHRGRPGQVWGWRYGTLEGHVEQGEMSWEVWKWLDSGEVEFRVDAIARPAPIANPLIHLGFRLLGPHERELFLRSTCERMRRLTELSLEAGGQQPLREAAARLTARPLRDRAPHEQLAANATGEANRAATGEANRAADATGEAHRGEAQ
jgi:uncharacterized protein (UPF0548 family)